MVEKIRLISREEFNPRTRIGQMVKEGTISSIEEIFDMGKPILEPEIADILLPDLESETLSIQNTHRITDSGRKATFRITVVIGDRKGHVGVGVGKSEELKPAIDYAVQNAKKKLISVKSSCGSWECRCQVNHSIARRTEGKQGSTVVMLKPAPRGLGLAASDVVKKVLRMAGIKDVWSSSKGGSNLYNTSIATIIALDNLNKIKPLPEKN